MKVLLAHPGTQHARHLAVQLNRKGVLHTFYTGIVLVKDSFPYQVIALFFPFLLKKMGKRILEDLPSDRVVSLILPELYAYCLRFFIKNQEEILHRRNALFQKLIPNRICNAVDFIIGFDTSSWILIRKAHRAGKRFILDQSIAHPASKEQVYAKIQEMYPMWSTSIPRKSPQFIAIEASEHQQSDAIVVASTFTQSTLEEQQVEGNKIMLNPYGVSSFFFHEKKGIEKNKPFVFLFVGSITSRKGIPLLLECWESIEIEEAELHLVGPISTEAIEWCKGYKNVFCKGSMSQKNVAKHMQNSDVFIFPSFFEGFGLVLLEAMAAGLPIVASKATAAPDLIDTQSGFVFEQGNKQELHEIMRYCIQNREIIYQKGINAQNRARLFSWDAYGDRWFEILKKYYAGHR